MVRRYKEKVPGGKAAKKMNAAKQSMISKTMQRVRPTAAVTIPTRCLRADTIPMIPLKIPPAAVKNAGMMKNATTTVTIASTTETVAAGFDTRGGGAAITIGA